MSLLRKKFVDEYHWIDENEMLDLMAIAQSSPGAIAVNASILIGYRLAGIVGAFITIICTILPSLIILSIIVMIGAFIATYFLKTNVMFIILICGIIGVIAISIKNKVKAWL